MAIFAMFRGLWQGRLTKDAVGGPIRITGIAYEAAHSGLDVFLQFLGMLSINLAVLNFLPIPPLDGGQMMFLIAEKVRGRPLPENALVTLTLAGISLVLVLVVFVSFNDVMSFFRTP